MAPSNQSTITQLFKDQSSNIKENFTINHFKRLLLDFIISNNISFKAITSLSFKKLLLYLNR